MHVCFINCTKQITRRCTIFQSIHAQNKERIKREGESGDTQMSCNSRWPDCDKREQITCWSWNPCKIHRLIGFSQIKKKTFVKKLESENRFWRKQDFHLVLLFLGRGMCLLTWLFRRRRAWFTTNEKCDPIYGRYVAFEYAFLWWCSFSKKHGYVQSKQQNHAETRGSNPRFG